MKIKIAYGVDMRLWKYPPVEDKPQPQLYQDLLSYIIKTFQFKDTSQFLIKYKDEDDELLTITSFQDFQDAFIAYKQQQKKSLKLQISDKPSIPSNNTINTDPNQDEKKEFDEPPIKSTINEQKQQPQNDVNTDKAKPSQSSEPTPEEINAFLSDDFVIDLLSDLFISVFEALEAASFEISFIECIQGIILSDDGKYDKITSNKVWPYFMDKLLPKYSNKIEMFVIPMIRNNGINSQMIKQWIPTMLNMMKMHQFKKQKQGGGGGCGDMGGFGGFPWRGRRGGRGGWRGRGWRHHHGHNGHHGHHGFGGWRGRGGRRGRGWRHHHGHHNHGHGHGFGYNPWFQQQDSGFVAAEPSAPQMEGMNGNNNNDNDEQMEAEFEYTEELVAIMNMGFTDIPKIKQLLNEHRGNKQNVVQELVLAKN